jgi:uncharacterized membrane protein
LSAPESDQREVQEELGIPNPAPIPKEVGPGQSAGTLNVQYNYNVNLPTVQLPSWEEFSKYPPEVREFWMRAGEKEQAFRHEWVEKEQNHRHQYDQVRLSGTFERQRTGQILGACLSIVCITAGVVIIIAGGSPWGFAAIRGGVAPLVGMAIYAKNVSVPKMEEGDKPVSDSKAD